MQRIVRASFASFLILALASCGNSVKDNNAELAGKKQELEKLKSQQ